MTSVVRKRLESKKLKVRQQAIKVASKEYRPELKIPEDELKAIAKLIVKMASDKGFSSLPLLKTLLTNLQMAMRKCKAGAKIDEREFESVVEGYLFTKAIPEEVAKTYHAMGYTKVGSTFKKKI